MSAAKVKQRWALLREAVVNKSTDISLYGALASVRRFESFGLLPSTALDGLGVREDEQWFEYRCDLLPDFHLRVRLAIVLIKLSCRRSWLTNYLIMCRQFAKTVSTKQLVGFNNTGNICVEHTYLVGLSVCTVNWHLSCRCCVPLVQRMHTLAVCDQKDSPFVKKQCSISMNDTCTFDVNVWVKCIIDTRENLQWIPDFPGALSM